MRTAITRPLTPSPTQNIQIAAHKNAASYNAELLATSQQALIQITYYLQTLRHYNAPTESITSSPEVLRLNQELTDLLEECALALNTITQRLFADLETDHKGRIDVSTRNIETLRSNVAYAVERLRDLSAVNPHIAVDSNPKIEPPKQHPYTTFEDPIKLVGLLEELKVYLAGFLRTNQALLKIQARATSLSLETTATRLDDMEFDAEEKGLYQSDNALNLHLRLTSILEQFATQVAVFYRQIHDVFQPTVDHVALLSDPNAMQQQLDQEARQGYEAAAKLETKARLTAIPPVRLFIRLLAITDENPSWLSKETATLNSAISNASTLQEGITRRGIVVNRRTTDE